jgi:hypothetical protein
MSQTSSFPFPKLTEEGLKDLELQISNLELLGKLQSRLGKLPKAHQERLQPFVDGLTSVFTSEPVPVCNTADQESLICLMKQWNEFALGEVKEWITFHTHENSHLTLDELFECAKSHFGSDPGWIESFLDMFHTICEKSQRSPESPQ